MAFLTENEINSLGFLKLGKNIKISNKASIYNHDQITIGDNSRIDDFCVLSGKIYIGHNVHIAVFCNIAGGEKGVFINDFAGLAYGVHVFSQSDDYSGKSLTNPTVPDEFKREFKKEVTICRHSIIGTNSVIFPGVTIAEGTAVGAMTMVTKSTEPWSMYFGVPAKKIKDRKKDLLLLESKFINGAK